jgi:arylsulfatase
MATSAPGNNSHPPEGEGAAAEILKLNGYSTAQIGKCHEVPLWEVTRCGPFTQWPTGSGFDYFYGFVGGEANQTIQGSMRAPRRSSRRSRPRRVIPSPRT